MKNPYNWQRHQPSVEVQRSQVEPILRELRRGGSAVVIGGRGMGKSVLLRQVQRAIEQSSAARAVLLSTPPLESTVAAYLADLARALGLATAPVTNTRDLIETYFSQDHALPQLVLLYDEFDSYAKSPANPTDSPGRRFFNDLEATRRDVEGLAVLAIGSIGVFVFRDILGSSFLSRATQFWLNPFEYMGLQTLAQPFTRRGQGLSPEILDALYLASGGHPALVTYGLQQLWDIPFPIIRSITAIFADFRQHHREFMRDVQLSFANPRLSDAPQRIWKLVKDGPGFVARAELQKTCGSASGPLHLDFIDVLNLLQAAGLIQLTGSVLTDDPIEVRPITSILNLPSDSSPKEDLRARFLDDLQRLLILLHTASADFFRSSGGGASRTLVPEAVFASFLSIGFELMGWQTEREAQQVAGRTDVKLARKGSNEWMIIEVKIWGRNDYREVHSQLESYWSASVKGGAVVMLTDAELPNWPEDYQRQCLTLPGIGVEHDSMPDSPICSRFSCTSSTAEGMKTCIDHFLLRLLRRGQRGLV